MLSTSELVRFERNVTVGPKGNQRAFFLIWTSTGGNPCMDVSTKAYIGLLSVHIYGKKKKTVVDFSLDLKQKKN